MKKSLVFVFSLYCLYAQAQQKGYGSNYWEAGFLFGLTNYSGDVTEKRVDIEETQPGFGAYARYHFSPHFSAKAHVYSGSVSGDDANGKNKERSFRTATNIIEFGGVLEWNILGRDRYSNTGIYRFFWTPFIYAGVGYTLTNNSVEYYGSPDRRNDYLRVPFPEENLKNRFILAPLGIGARADIMEFMVFSLEAGLRPVFSDDFDGIKINGNPNRGDWYYFAGATVSFILGKPKRR